MLVYFGQVEVIPEKASQLFRESPAVSGAFVNCLVSAAQQQEALKKLQSALREDGYQYLSHESMHALEEAGSEQLPELAELVSGMEETKCEIVYGVFHCYE